MHLIHGIYYIFIVNGKFFDEFGIHSFLEETQRRNIITKAIEVRNRKVNTGENK